MLQTFAITSTDASVLLSLGQLRTGASRLKPLGVFSYRISEFKYLVHAHLLCIFEPELRDRD